MVSRRRRKRAVEMMISFMLLLLLYSKTVYAAEEEPIDDFYGPIYNYEYYMEMNPDVKAVYGSGSAEDRVNAHRHFENRGMSEKRIASREFDINSYMRQYPDLRTAFGDDYKKYYLHYLKYGLREGRKATGCDKRVGSITVYKGTDYSAVFDADYYLAKYPDLRAAFGDDDVLAIRHFVRNGMREGRQAKQSFDVHSYRRAYQDLRLTYGNDLTKYYIHYIKYGTREKRVSENVKTVVDPVTGLDGKDYSAVYDFSEYQKRNSDVKDAFGDDDIATLRHFIKNGMKERRIANQNFNIRVYSNLYEDLQNEYNDDFKDYYMHYLKYGKKEGRKAVYTDAAGDKTSGDKTSDGQVVSGDVFRLYNRSTGEHLLTSDIAEKDKLLRSKEWSSEGMVWSYRDGTGIPVYRIYKPGYGHRFTQHKSEYDNCLKNGWRSEGICWYIDPTSRQDYYTLINPKAKSEVKKYIYTSEQGEINTLEGLGWIKLFGVRADVAPGILYAKDNKRSIDHYLGGKRNLVDYLTENQKAYLGKPYIDVYSPEFYEKYSISYGIQCASFVTIALQSIGCNTDIVIRDTTYSSEILSEYPNPYQASTWVAFADEHKAKGDIDVYTYSSVSELLSDGIAKKGDILIFDSTGPYGYYDEYGNMYDNHMGFFWGDEVIYDKMWHTAVATTGLGRLGYTVLYDGSNPGNQITNVTPVSSENRIYLLPVSQH